MSKSSKPSSVLRSPISSTKLRPLEYRVWRKLQHLQVRQARSPLKALPKKLIIGCSGGVDSMALLECMARIAPRLELRLEVASVHHGRASSRAQAQARDRAFKLVRAAAQKHQLPFHGLRRDLRLRELKSEQELRDYRHQVLGVLLETRGFDAKVFAHHADDLFETRLIRLIRGTGPQGLKSMHLYVPGILRPFLSESKKEIMKYASEAGLEWCDDPSNLDLGPLRNWLRHHWLKELEDKRPGGVAAFQRSLEILGENIGNAPVKVLQAKGDATAVFAIDLRRYRMMSGPEQRRELAGLLLDAGVRNFSSAQISEILRRIVPPTSAQSSAQSSSRTIKPRSFHVLQLSWKFNAEQILVSRA